MQPKHAFVDESTVRGYLLAAVLLPASALVASRRQLRQLVLPGQRRIHFTKERDDRRQRILDVIVTLKPHVIIYDATSHSDARKGRALCLTQLIADLTEARAERVVIETDDAAIASDRAVLYEAVRSYGVEDSLRYDHLRAREEVLLALADAVAWCWNKGGKWRSRIERHMVTTVHRL